MSDTRILDVRGLSCPQPALRAKQAIKGIKEGNMEILVDSQASRDNVSRLVQKAGWNVDIEGLPSGAFRLVLSK